MQRHIPSRNLTQQYRSNEVHTRQKKVKRKNNSEFNNKILEPHKHKDHKIHVIGRRKSSRTVKKKIINSEQTTAGITSVEEKDDQKVKIRPLLF